LDTLALRPEVKKSWERSQLCGVEPGTLKEPSYAEVNNNSRLIEAARPVMEHAFDELSKDRMCLMIASQEGRLQRLWVSGGHVGRLLDRAYVGPGLSVAESAIGTNALGIAHETAQPSKVSGVEHFAENYFSFACAAVPIFDPVNGKPIGAVDLTCRDTDWQETMIPWVKSLAREIGRRLLDTATASRDERLLMESYVRFASASRSRLVIALTDRTIISSSSAARILDGIDQALLWEQAARTIHSRNTDSYSFTLRDGSSATAVCQSVEDGGRVIGALIEIVMPSADARPQPAVGPARVTASATTLRDTALTSHALIGRSSAWRQAWTQAVAGREAGLPMLFRGEAGTGKYALASAIFEDQSVVVADAAMVPLDGFSSWASELRDLLAESGKAVLLRHIEELEDKDAQTVCSLLDAATEANTSLQILATQTIGTQPFAPLLDRFAFSTVDLPALRDRVEDLPDLLDELSRHAGGRVRRWRLDAIQALSRLDWPGNIRQLRSTVMAVCATHQAGDIGLQQLPGALLAGATRRQLSGLEHLEFNAILGTLRECQGNKQEAARKLQISRSTLYRKLRAFGMDLDRSAF
jgi:transcriptional regulator of acetoin/glycerol metabolism